MTAAALACALLVGLTPPPVAPVPLPCPAVCVCGCGGNKADCGCTTHGAPDPYRHLPPEKICELCYKQCEADGRALAALLDIVGGAQYRRYADLKTECDRRKQIWYAVWWVQWPEARAAQREEWAETLETYVGRDAFWRGELPLPLSLERR